MAGRGTKVSAAVGAGMVQVPETAFLEIQLSH